VGAGDFLGGLKSRSMPLLTVLLVSQASSLLLLAGAAVVRGDGAPDTGSSPRRPSRGSPSSVGPPRCTAGSRWDG
jgi:hypothetical protein